MPLNRAHGNRPTHGGTGEQARGGRPDFVSGTAPANEGWVSQGLCQRGIGRVIERGTTDRGSCLGLDGCCSFCMYTCVACNGSKYRK